MTAERPSRVPGFFSTLWLFRSKVFFSWDFAIAVAFAGFFATFSSVDHLPRLAVQLSAGALALAPALVGVVVAALAVVVALLDDDFLLLIDQATEKYGRTEGQLFPFWFVTATGVAAVLGAIVSDLIFDSVPEAAQRALLGAVTLFLVWTAVGVFNLVAYLMHTGISRVLFLRKKRSATASTPPKRES